MKGKSRIRKRIATSFVVTILILTFFVTTFIILTPEVKADPFSWDIYNIDTGEIQKQGYGYKIAVQSDGDIGIVYGKNLTADTTYCLNLIYATSSDNGQTWSYEDVYQGTQDSNHIDRVYTLCYNETDTPFIIFTNRTGDAGDFLGNHMLFWNVSTTSWETEAVYTDYRFAERVAMFNSTYQRRPHIMAVNYIDSLYDWYHYGWNQQTQNWDGTALETSNYNGRSVCFDIDDNDDMWTASLSINDWAFYNSSDGGDTWNDLGSFCSADGDCDDHMYGDLVINDTGVVHTVYIDEISGGGVNERVYYDYYDGSHQSNTYVGRNVDYDYEMLDLIDYNSTDSIFIAWQDFDDQDINISWSDDKGSTFSTELVYSGNASNNNDAELHGFIIDRDNGYHYITMVTGDDSNGIGGDRDIVIAVRQDPGGAISSNVNTISPYLQTSSPSTLTASAGGSPGNISLWYRWSDDNISWDGGSADHGNDTVDNNNSDIGSPTDVGSHSNFENQKSKDASFDTLTEENNGTVGNYVNQTWSTESNIDVSANVGTLSSPDNSKDTPPLDTLDSTLQEENNGTSANYVNQTWSTESNIDGSGNVGSLTSASNSQDTPPLDTLDSTLQEEDNGTSANYVNDSVDSNTSDVGSPTDFGFETDFDNAKDDSPDNDYMNVQEDNEGTASIDEWVYVDGLSTAETSWTTVGGSPYIDTQNQPTAYIWSGTNSALSSWYTFDTTTASGSGCTVNLSAYVDTSDGDGYIEWEVDWTGDGTADASGSFPDDNGGWMWVYTGTLSGLDTSTEIENARVRFMNNKGGGGPDDNYVDCARLGVSQAEVSTNYLMDFEYQWTSADNDETNEQVCIEVNDHTGNDDLDVDYWAGSSWSNLGTITGTGWSNFTATGLTGSTYTIRLNSTDGTSDTTQDDWNIDVIKLYCWTPASPNYGVDYEFQFTSVDNDETNEQVCIFLDGSPGENLRLYEWNDVSWDEVGLVDSDGWNNLTVSQVDESNYYILLKGATETSDTTQHSWSIDSINLKCWTPETINYGVDYEFQFTSVDNDETNEQVCIFLDGSPGENLRLYEWNDVSWDEVGLVDSDGWNNLTVSQVDESNYYILLKGATETSDTTQHSWSIDSINLKCWTPDSTNYGLDLEVQFTDISDNHDVEMLCIYTGSQDAEALEVHSWQGIGFWDTLFTDLTANSWNNISVSDVIAPTPFTLRFKADVEAGDTSQSTWEIDIVKVYYYNSSGDHGHDWMVWDNTSNPDTESPWSWDFDCPNGTMYYEFYSIANKTGQDNESAPGSKDAMCRYDPDANNVPVNSNPYPSDTDTGVELNPTLQITINDTDAHTMNQTFTTNATGDWIGIGWNNDSSNATVSNTTTVFTSFNTKYWWNSSVEDGNGGWDNDTYTFTTLGLGPPTGITAVAGEDWVNISWTENISTTTTLLEVENVGNWIRGPWARGSELELQNTSAEYHNYTGLTKGRRYFFQLWTYNSGANSYSSVASVNNITIFIGDFVWWLISDTEDNLDAWNNDLTYSGGTWSGEMIDEQVPWINFSTLMGDSLEDDEPGGNTYDVLIGRINATWTTAIGKPYPFDLALSDRDVHYFPSNHDYSTTAGKTLAEGFGPATATYNAKAWQNGTEEVGKEYNYTMDRGNLRFIYIGPRPDDSASDDKKMELNGTKIWLRQQIWDAYNNSMNVIMLSGLPPYNASSRNYDGYDDRVTYSTYWNTSTGWNDLPIDEDIEHAPYNYNVVGVYNDTWYDTSLSHDGDWDEWDECLINQSDDFWDILNEDWNSVAIWVGGNAHGDPDDVGAGAGSWETSIYNGSGYQYDMYGWDSFNGTGRSIQKGPLTLFVDDLHAGAWSDPNDEYSRPILFQEGSKDILIRCFEHEVDSSETSIYLSDTSFYSYAQDILITDALKFPYTSELGNSAPVLSLNDCEPDSGVDGYTPFFFNVTWTDSNNDNPTDSGAYLKVNITRSGWDTNQTMTWVSGANNTGAIYSYSTTLTTGSYSYTIWACDGNDGYDDASGGEPSVSALSQALTIETASSGAYLRFQDWTLTLTGVGLTTEHNVSEDNQTGVTPALNITNTGNVPLNITLNISGNPGTGIKCKYNLSDNAPNPDENTIAVSPSTTQIYTNLGVSSVLSVWVWMDFELVLAQSSSIEFRVNSTVYNQ